MASSLDGMTAAEFKDRLLGAVSHREQGEVLLDLMVSADLAKKCVTCETEHFEIGNLCAKCVAAAIRAEQS